MHFLRAVPAFPKHPRTAAAKGGGAPRSGRRRASPHPGSARGGWRTIFERGPLGRDADARPARQWRRCGGTIPSGWPRWAASRASRSSRPQQPCSARGQRGACTPVAPLGAGTLVCVRTPVQDYRTTDAPASATAWSCSPEPPLTPIAPTTFPSSFRGMPPAKIMIRP